MATLRGFVERIEVGRAGLVSVSLVEGDASRSTYVISDIDGDPERFNERLSKLAVARDAMNRAEPVEIDHSRGEMGEEIDRIARISRDQLDPPASVSSVSGLVIGLLVQSRNALLGSGEAHDDARVFVLDLGGQVVELRLDLQAPERLVVSDQLELIRALQSAGAMATFLVDSQDESDTSDIIAVMAGETSSRGERVGTTVSCFVESLGTILPPAAPSALGLTRVTTAPELVGPGGSVDPAVFEPQTLDLLLARNSDPYALVEAGLRDNVRMRVRYLPLKEGPGDGQNANGGGDGPGDDGAVGVRFQEASEARRLADHYGSYLEGADDLADGPAPKALLLSAELLAPLASASRPVWLHIDREMLDRGPEVGCTPGLPTSSLKVSSLRDLRIPYPAEWRGRGCFNHGVYRFQLTAPLGSSILVDGEEICLYPAGDDSGSVMVGYACLEGDHVITVVILQYVCDTVFELDAYRVR